MSCKPPNETHSIAVITPEDMELIKAMVSLPKESKVFARGIILGLSLTGDIAGLFTEQSH